MHLFSNKDINAGLFSLVPYLLLILMVFPLRADPMSVQYRLRWATFDGGAITASSASYKMKGSFAQTSVVGTSSSGSFQVAGGLFSIPDTDGDSVLNFLDNCIEVPNPSQYNANAGVDIYGNACDGDLDNSGGLVNFADLADFKSRFLTLDDEANINGTQGGQLVNFADLAAFKALFLKPVGPSGLPAP